MVASSLQKAIDRYKSSDLLRSGAWYVVGSFFVKGITFGSIKLYTALMSPQQFSRVSIFLTWVSIFSVIAPLYVQTATMRARFDLSEAEFKKYTSSILVFGAATSSLFVVIIALLPDNVLLALFNLPKSLVLLAAAIVPCSLGYTISQYIWEARSRYKPRVLVSLGLEIGAIVLSVILILASGDDKAHGRILGYALVNMGLGLFLLFRLINWTAPYTPRHWVYALRYSLPVIPHSLANVVLAGFDRVLIERYIGQTEAGIYSVTYQIGTVVMVIWAAANTAWVPWLYQRLNDGQYAIIRQRSRQYIVGFAILTGILIVSGPLIVRLMTAPTYWDGIRVVPLVMSSGYVTLLYSFGVNIQFYQRRTDFISVATFLAAVSNIVLNLLLIPLLGYSVAAWTTLISYVLLFVLHTAVVRRRYPDLNITEFPIMLLAGGMVIALAAFVYTLFPV